MVGLITAGVIAAVCCAVAIRLGHRLGILDRPDGVLKTHRREVVPLGGVGVFTGVHAALLITGGFDLGLFLASGVLLVAGLADDLIDVNPLVRLLVMTASALVLAAWSDLDVDRLGHVLVVLSAVVISVNAVNLLDGLDGLAGSSAVLSLVGIALLAMYRSVSPEFGLVAGGAVAGFVVFNWHPARIFLGDNGAYVTGVFLAYGVLVVSPAASSDVVVGAVMLGVFLVDLVATVVRRWSAGRPLFQGDRSHLYDQLRQRGWTVRAVCVAAITAQVGFIALALMLDVLDMGWWSIVPVLAVASVAFIGLDRGGLLRVELS